MKSENIPSLLQKNGNIIQKQQASILLKNINFSGSLSKRLEEEWKKPL